MVGDSGIRECLWGRNMDDRRPPPAPWGPLTGGLAGGTPKGVGGSREGGSWRGETGLQCYQTAPAGETRGLSYGRTWNARLKPSPKISLGGSKSTAQLGALSPPCDSLQDLLLRQSPLLLAKINGELQRIPSLAFPHVGPYGAPSQLFRRCNAVMTVREEQDAINVEHNDGTGIIQVLEVIQHPVGVQMWAAEFNRILRKIRNSKVFYRHETSLANGLT